MKSFTIIKYRGGFLSSFVDFVWGAAGRKGKKSVLLFGVKLPMTTEYRKTISLRLR